ncbi:nucleotidyltransferase domain-containing protein [Candidatus Gottesmanbacteria bacterium]|nr:nucleotidyltransferase domain-containing protein [Candidatus Gottesmanbacteria bacterium]
MDTSDQEIKNIVRQLVESYKAERVILFGSAANGEMTEDSDFDFLVVKRDVPIRGIDRHRELLGKIRYRRASDFLVCTPSEVTDRIARGDPFMYDIVTNGKVLYG